VKRGSGDLALKTAKSPIRFYSAVFDIQFGEIVEIHASRMADFPLEVVSRWSAIGPYRLFSVSRAERPD